MAKTTRSSKKSTAAPKVEAAAADAGGVVAAGSAVEDAGDAALSALIADLEGAAPLVAPTPVETAVKPAHTEAELHAAVAGAEAVELSIAAATPDGVIPAAGTTPAAPVKAKVPRKHYTDKTERLKDRVGGVLSDYTVLTVSDATDDPEAVKARMEETLAIIKKMNKKEQNRASLFIEFISGKKSSLNEVLHRTLKVLKDEGHITTGKEGNVMKNLLAKPYSVPSARAMSGNTISMFADLKVIVADGKGRYVGNPESTLLAKANSMLFAGA
jgi:hypothetical protein